MFVGSGSGLLFVTGVWLQTISFLLLVFVGVFLHLMVGGSCLGLRIALLGIAGAIMDFTIRGFLFLSERRVINVACVLENLVVSIGVHLVGLGEPLFGHHSICS